MNVQSLGRSSALVYAACAAAFVFIALFAFGCSSDDPVDPGPTPEPIKISSVGMIDVDKVRVVYSKQADETTASDIGNYAIMQAQTAVTVHRADLQPDGRTVFLSTDVMQTSQAYTATISGVKDAGGDETASGSKDVADEVVSGTIVTWVGDGRAGFDGDGNHLMNSSLYLPANLSFTSTGCYILDWNNHSVRLVEPDNTLRVVIGKDQFPGDGPPGFGDRNPPGVLGTTIHLNHPVDIDELPDGRILLSGWHDHKLRVYDPATGLAYVFAGEGADFDGDGGDARDARFSQPPYSLVLNDGTIFILDQRNQRIRRIDGATNIITTVAGTGVAGFDGDGGLPTSAQFNFPAGSNPRNPAGGLAMDSQGRLYIADQLNHRIRRCDFSLDMIETIAGDGTAGYSGDGGSALTASLNEPRDLEIGPDGRLYVTDEMNHRIRAIDLSTGVIVTVAGNGEAGFSGDGGPATQARLDMPGGIAFDSAGYLYIVDTMNHRVRRVIP